MPVRQKPESRVFSQGQRANVTIEKQEQACGVQKGPRLARVVELSRQEGSEIARGRRRGQGHCLEGLVGTVWISVPLPGKPARGFSMVCSMIHTNYNTHIT